MWIMVLIGVALWQSEARKYESRYEPRICIPIFFQGRFIEVEEGEEGEDTFLIGDNSITWRNLYDGSKKVIEADFVRVSKDSCVLETSEGETLATITYDLIDEYYLATLVKPFGDVSYYLSRYG